MSGEHLNDHVRMLFAEYLKKRLVMSDVPGVNRDIDGQKVEDFINDGYGEIINNIIMPLQESHYEAPTNVVPDLKQLMDESIKRINFFLNAPIIEDVFSGGIPEELYNKLRAYGQNLTPGKLRSFADSMPETYFLFIAQNKNKHLIRNIWKDKIYTEKGPLAFEVVDINKLKTNLWPIYTLDSLVLALDSADFGEKDEKEQLDRSIKAMIDLMLKLCDEKNSNRYSEQSDAVKILIVNELHNQTKSIMETFTQFFKKYETHQNL